jgi:hypothetical protein
MAKIRWGDSQIAWFYANPGGAYEQFCDAFPDGPRRTYNAWRVKKADLELGHDGSPTPRIVADTAREPQVNWREWVDPIRQFQALRRKAKGHVDTHAITIEATEPVAFIVLGDTHLGAWTTDHDLLVRITDEILSVPGLYIALVGDLAHMAIKMRNVTEVADNIVPADMQYPLTASWLMEMQERILFAIWGNHEVERAEAQAGLNPFGDLYRKVARHYFNGIGHLTLRVNGIDYQIAASHHFRGRSIYSPVHGCQRYLVMEGIDRDIAIAGDSHVPGVLKFTHGRETKLAVNCGSAQIWSGYANRYFSLFTHPVFPVVVLDHEAKNFHACWNLREYLQRRGSATPIPVIH